MSTTTFKTRELEGDDVPRVIVTIKLRRSIGSLPVAAQHLWSAVKAAVFLIGTAAAVVTTIWPNALALPLQLRIAIALVVIWFVWDRTWARRTSGTSYILVTTHGVLISDENLYVKWDEIESYQIGSDRVRLRPKPEARPTGAFAPREFDIPLDAANRPLIADLFAENVSRWSPDRGEDSPS